MIFDEVGPQVGPILPFGIPSLFAILNNQWIRITGSLGLGVADVP